MRIYAVCSELLELFLAVMHCKSSCYWLLKVMSLSPTCQGELSTLSWLASLGSQQTSFAFAAACHLRLLA